VRLNTLFGDDSDIVFIPAGRSVLATLSEQLQDIPYPSMDLIMQEFINRIRDTRRNFGSRIPEIIQDYLKTVKGQINNSAVNLAYELIHEILRADYVSDKGEEKIYYDESHWVKLLFASSGQQESLWLLLPCFMQILQQRKSLFIIEEPEAHLFPYAQRNIMELIALLANATNSTVLISTHSPYILTSTNLLLYSGAVEKQNSQRDAVIRPMLRIMPSIFSAFSIDNGKLTDLFDEETSMIMAEYIDSVSTVINEDLDRLMEKEGA
jgi:predicted ATPase